MNLREQRCLFTVVVSELVPVGVPTNVPDDAE
jgi:hypothetical protein